MARQVEEVGRPPAPKPGEFQFVRYRLEGEVARLTLDRPEHNLLNERMLVELATGIELLGDHPDVKLIVLNANGKTFCGGIELGEYTSRRVFPGAGRISQRV